MAPVHRQRVEELEQLCNVGSATGAVARTTRQQALLLLQQLCARAAPCDPIWSLQLAPVVSAVLVSMRDAADGGARAQCAACVLNLLRSQSWRLRPFLDALLVELLVSSVDEEEASAEEGGQAGGGEGCSWPLVADKRDCRRSRVQPS